MTVPYIVNAILLSLPLSPLPRLSLGIIARSAFLSSSGGDGVRGDVESELERERASSSVAVGRARQGRRGGCVCGRLGSSEKEDFCDGAAERKREREREGAEGGKGRPAARARPPTQSPSSRPPSEGGERGCSLLPLSRSLCLFALPFCEESPLLCAFLYIAALCLSGAFQGERNSGICRKEFNLIKKLFCTEETRCPSGQCFRFGKDEMTYPWSGFCLNSQPLCSIHFAIYATAQQPSLSPSPSFLLSMRAPRSPLFSRGPLPSVHRFVRGAAYSGLFLRNARLSVRPSVRPSFSPDCE